LLATVRESAATPRAAAGTQPVRAEAFWAVGSSKSLPVFPDTRWALLAAHAPKCPRRSGSIWSQLALTASGLAHLVLRRARIRGFRACTAQEDGDGKTRGSFGIGAFALQHRFGEFKSNSLHR